MTFENDFTEAQTIILDNEDAQAVYVRGASPDDTRIFYDLAGLFHQFSESTILRAREARSSGDPMLMAQVKGEVAILEAIRLSAVALLDGFEAQDAVNKVQTIADLGWDTED